ncbi:MAG TPA: FAD/NAD(P)-binding protein [Acidimicrobiales bacterium]|nr:FAD/NAD(P)-binding protein [Acidimicrobiales bacterium]
MPTDVLTPTPYRVVSRRRCGDDVATFDVTPIDHPIDRAEPGQFAMLWAYGIGEVPISFRGVDAQPGRLRFTVRAVGEVSDALVALTRGDVVGVRGPFGRGWKAETEAGRDIVVVAGGLGVCPLWPVVSHLRADRLRFGRISLLVGARSPADLLDVDDLVRWAELTGAHLGVSVDHPSPGWDGNVGLVTDLLDEVDLDPEITSAFVCGPEVMMLATGRALVDRGLAPERIRLSLERNMACGIRHCGRCQVGPLFACVDGPVVDLASAGHLLEVSDR